MRKITLPQTLAFVAQWLVALALAGEAWAGVPAKCVSASAAAKAGPRAAASAD